MPTIPSSNSVTMTINTDKTAYLSNDSIGNQQDIVTITVVVPVSVSESGFDAYVDFVMPDGSVFFKGPYDCSSGTFSFTIGEIDSIINKDGTLSWQFLLAETSGIIRTIQWLADKQTTIIKTSIEAELPATIPPQTGILLDAENVSYNGYSIGDTAEEAIDHIYQDLTNLSFTGSTHDALVMAALVDVEGEDFGINGNITYLDGRHNKWENRIVEIMNYTLNIKSSIPDLELVTGDGITDDTIAINAMLQYAKLKNIKTIYFPKGTYIIDGTSAPAYFYHNGGIVIDFSVGIILHQEAIIQVKTSSEDGYNCFTVRNVENVSIRGGSIRGERDTHVGVTGEFGFGIYGRDAKNITIENVNITNFWGDGIIFDAGVTNFGESCENIIIKDCIVDSNRRNGITISDGIKFRIINNNITNTDGTAPKSGIDIEGNANTIINDCIIQNNYFNGNTTSDITISNKTNGLKITDNYTLTSGRGINISPISVNVVDTIISRNVIVGIASAILGIEINPTAGKGITIENNIIQNILCTDYGAAIEVTTDIKNTHILNNNIYACDYGIRIAKADGLSINNNTIRDITFGGITYIATPTGAGNTEIMNNLIKTCGTYGINSRLKKGSISNNTISSTQEHAIYLVGTQDAVISGNNLEDFGLASGAGVYSDNAATLNNFISGNYFKSTSTQKAINITQTPSGSPNIVHSNVALYTSGAISVDANCISDGNYTV